MAWASRDQNGYGLAVASVAATLLARFGLETFGQFYYLPLLPAVILPALLASRGATVLAIALSVAANIVLVPEDSVGDGVANALLFVAVGLAIGEIGRARQSLKVRSIELKGQLSTRDATLHAMLASAPVLTLDARSNIRTLSPPACALFRTSERQARGRPVREFIDGFDAARVRAPAPGEPGMDPCWTGRRADGEVFPVGVQLGVVGDDPATAETLLTLTDLSLWRAAEARNQQLRDQLHQVWRMNSLGEMAAVLSHELNQPLTAAAAYLQAGRAGLALDDAAGRPLDLARGEVVRAGAIIRRARELLTVDARPLEPGRVSSMIDDLGPILRLLGPAAGVAVRIDLAPDDRVMADRIQLQQALVNLVRNAVEAVAGRDRREVRILGRAAPDGRYEIRIEDSGPGVAPDRVARLFEPMTTTKADGMGLGLSVTRKIVEAHGGVLDVARSDLGGAAFVFTIPRATEAPAP